MEAEHSHQPLPTGLLIGGEWLERAEHFPVENPATEEVLAEVAAGSAADASDACEAAAAAQPAWAARLPRERGEILRACWETLIWHTDELAELITLEHGKPLAHSRAEIVYAAEHFRWNAEEAVRIHGSLGVAPAGRNRIIVRHPPVGVVIMITPWNFPAAMITRKVAPALAAGNTMVIKPAHETPLTPLRIGQLLHEAGVPPGVINIVPTVKPAEVYDAAVDHAATRMVSFTGSTEVGRILLKRAADRVLKVTMELGGNAPFIVFADADLDAAVEGAMAAKMRHSAETCTAANRFFVEAAVFEEFTTRFAGAMAAYPVGNGLEPGVMCGPMINATAIDSIDELVSEAVGQGARVAVGGRRLDRPGHFYEPTVLAGVEADAPITRHEIFGPVAPLIPFTDTDEMVAAANDTETGLAAYVYSGDLRRGLQVSERLDAGMVGLNRGSVSDPAAPFGGMKQSGLGREGASEGIYEFTETQYIATEW
jgi:succinate-semialdehyde dehydrogenase/glutarate-semialdehyde dehydrogenase